jgi:hypothetical protein
MSTNEATIATLSEAQKTELLLKLLAKEASRGPKGVPVKDYAECIAKLASAGIKPIGERRESKSGNLTQSVQVMYQTPEGMKYMLTGNLTLCKGQRD